MSNIIQNVDLSHPLTDHPIWKDVRGVWLPCGNTAKGNTLYDLGPYGNHGTLTNMDPATDWVATERGIGLDFDGVNQYIDLGESSKQNFSGHEITVAFTAYADSSATTGEKYISNSHGGEYDVVINAGEIEWYTNSVKLIGPSIPFGTWSHWVLRVCSGETNGKKIALNGVFMAEATEPNDISQASSNTYIGQSPIADRQFVGSFGPVLLFARTLSASEIAFFYEQSLTGYPDLIRQVPIRKFFFRSPTATIYQRRRPGIARVGSRGLSV